MNKNTKDSLTKLAIFIFICSYVFMPLSGWLKTHKTYVLAGPVVPTTTEGTEAVEETTEDYSDITKLDIAEYIVATWGYGEDAQIALAVFQCESGLNPNAVNKDNWLWGSPGDDHGIAQINDYYHRDKFDNVEQLYDPVFNINLAKEIWNHSGWTAWSCFKSGAYLNFIEE